MKLGTLQIAASPAIVVLALLAAIGLAAWLTWLGRRGASRRRILLRFSAHAVALLSLLALVLEPHWLSRPRRAAAVLFTEGTTPALAAAALDTFAVRDQIYQLPAPGAKLHPDAIPIPDLGYWQRHFPQPDQLLVTGHGLTADELRQLRTTQVQFLAAELAPGMERIAWSQELEFGQELVVSGRFSGLQGLLKLSVGGGITDSIFVKSSGLFRLVDRPATTGALAYRLHLHDDAGDTIFAAQLPLYVRRPDPVAILVLEGAPRFETRFFKQWASEAGHAVAVRSAISQRRYRSEFLNRSEEDLSTLDAALLATFDVLLLDSRTLGEMTSRELEAIQAAIASGGAGALLLPAGLPLPKAVRRLGLTMEIQRIPQIDQLLVRPSLAGRNGAAGESELPALPAALVPDWQSQPLVRDQAGRVLVALQQVGQGRLGVSLVHESYRWMLGEEQPAYAGYWSHVVSKLARRKELPVWQPVAPHPAFVDQPLTLTLLAVDQPDHAVLIDPNGHADTLFFRQHPANAWRWEASVWPRNQGWHRARSPDGAELHFFVEAKDRWPILQQSRRRLATQQHMLLRDSTKSGDSLRAPLSQPVPAGWFFALFVLASACLWLERKLS